MQTMDEIDRQLEAERQALIAAAASAAHAEYEASPYVYFSKVDKPPEILGLQYQIADRALPTTYGIQQPALAVISYLGVLFHTEDDERAVELLGLVLAQAAVIATLEHMSLAPLIALGRAMARRQDVQPIRASGALAAAAGSIHGNREAQALAVADGLGLAIAKALDDVEIGHGLTVEPIELFGHIAREVIAGKLSLRIEAPPFKRNAVVPGVITTPLPAPAQHATMHDEDPTVKIRRPTPERQAELAKEWAAAASKPLERGKDGIVVNGVLVPWTPEQQAAAERMQAAVGELEDARLVSIDDVQLAGDVLHHPTSNVNVINPIIRDKKDEDPPDAMSAWRGEDVPAGEPAATLQRMARQGPPPGVTPLPRADHTSEDAAFIAPATAEERRLGVSAATVCPKCAAPMVPFGATRDTATSEPDGTVYRCSNGHEVTKQQLMALRLSEVQATEQAARVKAAILAPPVERSARHFPPPRQAIRTALRREFPDPRDPDEDK